MSTHQEYIDRIHRWHLTQSANGGGENLDNILNDLEKEAYNRGDANGYDIGFDEGYSHAAFLGDEA